MNTSRDDFQTSPGSPESSGDFHEELGGGQFGDLGGIVRRNIQSSIQQGLSLRDEQVLLVGTNFGRGREGKSRYSVVRRLGSGGTALVYLVHDREYPGILKALKVGVVSSEQRGMTEMIHNTLRREVIASSEISSAYIIKTYGDIFEEFRVMDPSGKWGKLFLHAHLIRFYEGGDLYDWIKKNSQNSGGIDTGDALSFSADICEAAADIHRAGFTHGDIKTDNVFVDVSQKKSLQRTRVVLSDFGLSMHQNEVAQSGLAEKVQGTAGYMSPELIKRMGVATASDDVYALGCIVYQLIADGKFPTHRQGADWSIAIRGTEDAAREKLIRIPQESEEKFGPEACKMVLRMLGPEENRPSAQEAVKCFRRLAWEVENEQQEVRKVTDLGGVLGRKRSFVANISPRTAQDLQAAGLLNIDPESGATRIAKPVDQSNKRGGVTGLVRGVCHRIGMIFLKMGR